MFIYIYIYICIYIHIIKRRLAAYISLGQARPRRGERRGGRGGTTAEEGPLLLYIYLISYYMTL